MGLCIGTVRRRLGMTPHQVESRPKPIPDASPVCSSSSGGATGEVDVVANPHPEGIGHLAQAPVARGGVAFGLVPLDLLFL